VRTCAQAQTDNGSEEADISFNERYVCFLITAVLEH
jgi:hypothetical protein